MNTLIIADVHLGAEHPEISERFIALLNSQRCQEAESLYILGDLFELWIGDDAPQPEHLEAIGALKTLNRRGVDIALLHGNRDFLLGHEFAAMSGCRLLSDPTCITLHGEPTLLMHGDTLCSDDSDYQRLRGQLRNPEWQQQFLKRTAAERLAFAHQLRRESQRLSQEKSSAIMDVNPQRVIQLMQEHAVRRLIHGHTHRPAIHDLTVDDAPAQRIVLGDWYQQNSLLNCDATGCQFVPV